MTDRADDPLSELSRGMVQRVAAARAVLHDPPLLLLDEPWAGLDPAAVELLTPVIGRASGKTRVVVTHDVAGGLEEADVTLGLKAGTAAPVDRRGGHPGAVPVIATAVAILRKDLTVELRTRESVPAMVLFSLTVFVLFHFGLDRDTLDGDLATGVIWVTLLLAALLAVNRLYVAERDQGGFVGMRLAPIDLTSLWLAKASALFLYLVALEIVALPAFDLLLLGPGLDGAFPELLPVLLLANLGLAAVGALISALAIETRARDLIVPLLLLPLLVPVIIAAAQATEPLFTGSQSPDDLAKWLGFLALYDVVFVLVSVAVFDFLLDE